MNNNFEPLVSVIIPIYNIEKYLNKCVDSILCQTYANIEVILVDDGSSDNSPILCDDYAKADKRVKVVHKKNGGLSDARNTGMEASSGEYLIFLDGDDFWPNSSSLETLMNYAKDNQDLDFVCFNWFYYYPESDVYTKYTPYNQELSSPTNKNKAVVLLIKDGDLPMSACNKLLNRVFLITNKLFFKSGIIAEDIPWFINVLEKTQKCCFVNEYIYAYRQNVMTSLTRSGGMKSFRDLFATVKEELLLLEKRGFSNEAKQAIYSFLAYEYSILLLKVNSMQEAEKKEWWPELQNYKWLLDYDLNPKVRMISRVNRIFGLRNTVRIMGAYRRYQLRRK